LFFAGCQAKSKFWAVSFQDVNQAQDMNAYAAEVVKNGVSNDGPLENGIVICPYYTLKINCQEVPVYSTRTGNGVHSFAYIDVEKDNFVLDVTIELKNAHRKIIVLPLSANVNATLKGKTVKTKITKTGSFSFAFDDNPNTEALTIFAAKESKLSIPEGYQVQNFNPGRYTFDDLNFTQSNTVYYFRSGNYEITSMKTKRRSLRSL
jgi:hypothetical protein